ncbi:MAG: HmuY family protein [Nitrospinae bacterium]|nr:HmuY family protein [Nitrospinota bacterium]
MNNTLNIFGMLLAATFLFHATLSYMTDNIVDFETVALPPKRIEPSATRNPTVRVDAASRDVWTLLDFATGKTYSIQDPEKEKARLNEFKWDLGFQRTKIITNGGETNPRGAVGVVNLGKIDIDDVKEAPETGYLADTNAWGKLNNPSLADWYLYRTRTHNIESQKNVYVARTADKSYVKFRILNYYCNQNESDCATAMCPRDEAACITLEYVRQPSGERIFPAPVARESVAAIPSDRD